MAKQPKQIPLTEKEAAALKQRLLEVTELNQKDKELLAGLLTFNLWLQQQLSKASFTIKKLKGLFGFISEKKKKTAPDVEENSLENATEPDSDIGNSDIGNDSNTDENKPKPKKKPVWSKDENHGRYGADDYDGLSTVTISHETLQSGGTCPDCHDGKVYAYDAGSLIRLVGAPLVTGTCYVLEGYRCNLCSKIHKPDVPEEISKAPKFAPSAISNIAIGHYSLGLPFNRIEFWQKNCHIPLPDSTQYDEMAKLSIKVLPVVQCLKEIAANGSVIYYDDTPFNVMELSTAHGTAVVSQSGENWIYLFYASQRIAGKEVSQLLSKRTSNDEFITMTDASNQNHLSELDETLMSRLIIAYCLVHGRRKFYELLDDFPNECRLVIDCIADVYRNEAHCKQNQLSPSERLEYHRVHSRPMMDALHIYLKNLWQHGGMEQNSTLGNAVKYMLKHWPALTRFLTVEGCPLDNSLCERAIKVLIRYRKNSLFYRTLKGAVCGDTLMSLIHTAMCNNVNAFDYLNALQEHAKEVALNPEGFLPWNYDATLLEMEQSEMSQAEAA